MEDIYRETVTAIENGANFRIDFQSRSLGFESARKYIRQILNNFSFATPGTTYEVSPDYGMFVQAWNVSGYNIPLIHYVFGVDPMAYKKEINIKTDIPASLSTSI